jgi:hypothetical protein
MVRVKDLSIPDDVERPGKRVARMQSQQNFANGVYKIFPAGHAKEKAASGSDLAPTKFPTKDLMKIM